ncbi:dnaJ homolog subfamily B member 13-like [Sabethes cyaneus]|uniref:dnaJ homolog subfamily B member 13-like n=1 Tax=Sabethes cyaneus TaxID=53552 RepID=UPI00237DB37C|nr:dnaJ homolog subfamily B member 13-like [Sabethes cyaneus]
MGFDYYAILDIPKSASDVEIRLAYRKWAVRCHPQNDFHETPEIPFPSMSIAHYWELLHEAFEVLSNPLRKRIYDIYGEEGLKAGVVTPTGYVEPYKFSNNCMKIYKDFFATYSPYADLIDAVTNPPPLCQDDRTKVKIKGPDIEHAINLDLEEIFYGTIKKMQIVRDEFADDSELETILVEETLTVHISRGIPTGTKIRFEEAGDRNPKIIPSDIVFVVKENPHPVFWRKGADLYTVVQITVEQALVGFPLEITGIDGRQLVIQIVDVVEPNFVKVLQGEGLPIPGGEQSNSRGDLFVSFEGNIFTIKKICH